MRKSLKMALIVTVAVVVCIRALAWAQVRLGEISGQVRESARYERQKGELRGPWVSVIVKLQDASLAGYTGGVAGLPATSPSATGGGRLDVSTPASQAYLDYLDGRLRAFEEACHRVIPDARLTHVYKVVIGGAALLVPADQVALVSTIPGVAAVYRDRLLELDTNVSPAFIGADEAWDELGGQEKAGEGVIVGVLDTGVWPEHPSYADPDPFGNSYDPPPTAPGSNGFGSGGSRSTCDFGDTAWNSNDDPFTCNNKLIGAYEFLDTYKAVLGLLPTEFDSARDDDGHGTHTSSTAAGNGGVLASIYGIDRGVVSGIAPRAHVIMYRVCALDGCFTSDSARAVEQAILDDVDVVNFSIGGGTDPYNSVSSLAFLDAYDAGVLVSASAGNAGPAPDTVSHREPWTITVGASTTVRHFLSEILLTSAEGDTLMLEGATVTDGIFAPTPVVFPPAGEELCLDPFPPGTFSGEIVICERGIIARVAKSFNVGSGGAGGMLLYNPALQGLATDNHFVPSVHLEFDQGTALLAFMASHTGVMGTFTQGTATEVQGDKMAAFSSRGGPGQTLGISKPDVTAPGVQILAGNSPMHSTITGGAPDELFQSIQGTSMSSPHNAGAAALVKALHPDWGPGQIKSSLMTTAKHAGVVKEDGVTPADPFDLGSGRIALNSLNGAGNPGITIVDSATRFVGLRDELWNVNYPSLYIPVHPGITTVERTLHDETGQSRNWKLEVTNLPGDLVVEVPGRVEVPKDGEATFDITVDARNVPIGETRHANLKMTARAGGRGDDDDGDDDDGDGDGDDDDGDDGDGDDDAARDLEANFPITIVRRMADVVTGKSCAPTVFAEGETTDCSITITNTSFDDANVLVADELPDELDLVSVSGATPTSDGFFFDGTLFGAAPPNVNVAVDPGAPPFGYVPLSGFGGTIDVGASDESIANFGVPSFEYAGMSNSVIGVVSNGYVVVGGGTSADVDFINTDLPDPAVPNNILAPFWTDLNPSAGGRVLINVLTDGADVWTIVEWEAVPNFGNGLPNTAQVWIGTNTDANPAEDIFFVYGTVSGGDGGFLTVGAENEFGNSGGTTYFDGAGVPPSPTATSGYAVDVFSTPGAPGETMTITFTAEGDDEGEWQNCATIESNIFFGISTACESGEVLDEDDGHE